MAASSANASSRSSAPDAVLRRPLVIGWGSLLHGDDGAGPRVVEAVARLAGERCDSFALVQLLPELAPRLAAAAAAVLVDAAAADPPGQVAWRVLGPRDEAGPGEVPLSHELTPQALVEMAAQLFGRAPEVALVSISGACFELGPELSPEVARAIEPAARSIVAWLDERARGLSALQPVEEVNRLGHRGDALPK